MTFEDDNAWFYLMNAQFDMFKVVMPYEVLRELWAEEHPEATCTDAAVRAWLGVDRLRVLMPIHFRAQIVKTSTDHGDDTRVAVIPIDKGSVLYQGAWADRQASLTSQDADTQGPSFAPPVRFIYGPGELCDDDLRDIRPAEAPPQPIH